MARFQNYFVGLLLTFLIGYIQLGNCQTQVKCPTGMVFNECGSACNSTCADPNPVCTANCVRRCECPKGTVLNNGGCLAQTRCPKKVKCPTGMVFNECGSACNSTCADPNPMCTANCVSRCECPQGTVLNNGGCLAQTRCPKNVNTTCKYGQVFKQCASACTKTCDKPLPYCTKQCVQKCECPTDKPLLFNGACVESTRCPKSNLTCDNSYSPMKPFVRRVAKQCNKCSWWKRGCTKVDCSYDKKTCCRGYQLYWDKCATECGGCSNKAVPNQQACFHRNLDMKALPYCCPSFSLMYENREPRCRLYVVD